MPKVAPNRAFFLDIDGTLLTLAATPAGVTADSGLKQTLGRLRTATGGAIALISGRQIGEVDRLFAPLRLPTAGQHGIERRDGSGVVHRHAAPSCRFGEIKNRLAPLVARHPGKMVVEIIPIGSDKGSTIAEFMSESPFRGRIPVFLGDDVTDEYGFSVVNAMDGHSIKVRPGRSATKRLARFSMTSTARRFWRRPMSSLTNAWCAVVTKRCFIWYIYALAAIGRMAEARELFEKLLACRNRHGLLAEDIDPRTRERWGNFVQTYSMVGLINAAIRLSIRWDQAF